MSLTAEFKAELAERGLVFREADHVADAIAEADVIYMEPVVQADYTKSRDEGARTAHHPGQLPGHPGGC